MTSQHVDIKFLKNGYVVTFLGFLKENGQVVYKFTEELKMLEEIGLHILGKKIEAKEK